MENRIVGALIVVAVAIIALGAVLMPVITDVTAKTDTFQNDSLFFVDSVPQGTTITYEFVDGTLYVNDQPVIVSGQSPYEGGVSILFTEHIVIRSQGDNLLRIRGIYNHNVSELSITVSDSTIVGTAVRGGGDGTIDINWEYTSFYGIVPFETNRAMVYAPAYVNPDSVINITGLSRVAEYDNYYVVEVHGSIEDGFTALIYNQNTGEAMGHISTEVTPIYSPVNNYNGVYLLDSLEIVLTRTIQETGVVETAELTFTIFTAPYEVVGDRAEPLADSYSNLIYTIPVMLIISILLLAVGLFVRSRY